MPPSEGGKGRTYSSVTPLRRGTTEGGEGEVRRGQPLVLVFEDLHWADSLSLDLILLLMEMLTLAPMMLICVYRPEQDHKSWRIGSIASSKCLDRYTEIHLRELRPQESRRMVEELLRIDNLPERVKALILTKSEGNPFFVEEVIRSLIDSGIVYREGEVWAAKAEIESLAVPDTMRWGKMAGVQLSECTIYRSLALFGGTQSGL